MIGFQVSIFNVKVLYLVWKSKHIAEFNLDFDQAITTKCELYIVDVNPAWQHGPLSNILSRFCRMKLLAGHFIYSLHSTIM